jgi:prevent-host-death family protein
MNATTRLKFSEARSRFGDVLNRAEYARERVVVVRHGRESAAIVPLADLRVIEAFEEQTRQASEEV